MDDDLRLRGAWCGLGGALVLLVGDQCLYAAAVSGAQFVADLDTIVAAAPTGRVLFGAALGPFGALLYLAGFWHVHGRLRDRHPHLASGIALLLAMCILAGSAYHVLWGAKALAIKAVVGSDSAAHAALAAHLVEVRAFAATIYWIAAVPGYVAGMLLAALILAGHSTWPRWMSVFTPAIPMTLLQLVGPWVAAPFGSIAMGSAANLSFALFFAVSASSASRSNGPTR